MASSPATSLALIALLVASFAKSASAMSFTVGDAHGWTTGVDYAGWTSGKTFAVGDTLVFNYTSKGHTVTEVSKSGYEACSGSNSLSNDDNAPTTITLTSPGTHYFICTFTGHCSEGMKLAVSVSGSPGAPSSSGTTPSGAVSPLLPASSLVAAVAAALIKFALF